MHSRSFRWAAACALAFASVMPRAAVSATASGSLAVPAVTAPPSLDPNAAPAAWAGAATVALPWDVQHQARSSEATEVRVLGDGANLFVRFDVTQRETLLAQQHTNEVGDGTDDEVWIDLWPNGSAGFYYQFAATSNGTHFQYSSENTAYSPTWWSYGATRGGGFTVTMKIPLRVMRGSGGNGGWKVQFVRVVRSTGERQIWSWGAAQTNGDDVTYAGALTGIAAALAVRPPARVALYGLGGAGPGGSGLTTSRTGADLSIPLTATSSFYATIHPDFSNVEIDQQTISPTAFQRVYTEVRPFFTQGANYFNPFDCDVCPYLAELYTPAIPTPRDGYAVEGKQGPLSFAAFDAVGDGRNDAATSMYYKTADNQWTFSAQSVDANVGDVTDHVDTTGIHFNDNQHVDAFLNYGSDSGTNVLDGGRAQRYDGGAYYYTNTFGIGASLRKYGEYYDPVDGLVQHPDIAGYGAFENKIWLFGKNDVLNSIQLGTFVDRYHDHTGALDQTDNAAWIDFLTRNLIDIQGTVGSSYLRLPSGIFTPVSQNGAGVTWHSGSANNPGNNLNHGSSATPTTITWNSGRFGPGRLDAWTRLTTMRAGSRGTLSLEFDDTRDYLDTHATSVQWLERLSYTYAAGANASFSLGVRRIIGTAPLIDVTQPPAYTNAYNLSFAYHRRTPHDELYLAYGDASQLTTVPQFVIKLIHYFGAEKGT